MGVTAWKVCKYWVISGPNFLVFKLRICSYLLEKSLMETSFFVQYLLNKVLDEIQFFCEDKHQICARVELRFTYYWQDHMHVTLQIKHYILRVVT